MNKIQTTLYLFILFLIPISIFSQVELVSDPYLNTHTGGGNPQQFDEMGSDFYFMAYADQQHNLWKSDGTKSGTHILEKGIIDFALEPVNKAIYFTRFNDELDLQLYRSEGIPGDNEIVKTFLREDDLIYNIRDFVAADGKVFFTAKTFGRTELWITDGTESGTQLVLDPSEETSLKSFGEYFSLNEKLIIGVWNDDNSMGLWSTDATLLNPEPLIDFDNPDPSAPNFPYGFYEFDNALYFFVRDSLYSSQLWKTEGSESTTVLIGDAGERGFQAFSYMEEYNGELFFFKRNVERDTVSLIKTNGQPGDIQLVKTLGVGFVYGFGNIQNEMMFVFSRRDTANYEFWKCDGTIGGTEIFKEFSPFDIGYGFGMTNSLMFFNKGDSLWRTDGTEAGTFGISKNQPYKLFTQNYISFQDKLFYAGIEPLQDIFPDIELYVTDGTSGGTELFFDTNTTPSYNFMRYFVSLSGMHFYMTDPDTTQRKIWVTDCTNEGSEFLNNFNIDMDLFPYSGVISYHTPVEWRDKIYFRVKYPQTSELWQIDGTEAGTKQVALGEVDEQFPLIGNGLAVYKDQLFFQGVVDDASQNNFGSELWKLSSPDAEPELVMDIKVGAESGNPGNLIVLNDKLIFTASTDDEGLELWTSDGTTNGTHLLKDIFPGSIGGAWYFERNNVVVGDKLYFLGKGQESEKELWVTDATSDGTHRVANIKSGPGGHIQAFIPFGDKVVYSSSTTNEGVELWMSDGTEDGSKMIKDIYPGSNSSLINFHSTIIANNSFILFQADHPDFGQELWRSDGTETGTYLVKDLLLGSSGSQPHLFTSTCGNIYFVAKNTKGRVNLWETNGTETGTKIVDGFDDESPFFRIWDLVAAGNKLLFIGHHVDHGVALFSFNADEGIICIDENQDFDLLVYPNPARSFINVHLKEPLDNNAFVNILDVRGRRISGKSSDLESGTRGFRIDLSGLAAGLYFVQMIEGEKIYTEKFIVKHE